MQDKKRTHGFLFRIFLCIAAFSLLLLSQQYMEYYRGVHILNRMDRQIRNLSCISSFLERIGACIGYMDEYLWDFGDSHELRSAMSQGMQEAQTFLLEINDEIGSVSQEQYLYAQAAKNVFHTYDTLIGSILDTLDSGDISQAAELYYSRAVPCGGYLQQYARQLLERTIFDGQVAYEEINRLNSTLKLVQTGITVSLMVIGTVALAAILRIIRPVDTMIRASDAIIQGDYYQPDIPVKRQDEMSMLQTAFNSMKHSMAQQVQTLREKNEMQLAFVQQEKEALELKHLVEQERLQQLRSQIKPHFLFNTLNVIVQTAEQEQAHKTQELLYALTRFLRYTLISNATLVPLANEIHIIDEFYKIYHTRFGERVRLRWEISDAIDPTELLVPSLILQPLVGNAFKYGICPKEEGGLVTISLEIDEPQQKLLARVEDNGMGMSPEKLKEVQEKLEKPPESGEHIGVYNVAARLRLSRKDCGISIQSEQGVGTSILLEMPLMTMEDDDDKDSDCG